MEFYKSRNFDKKKSNRFDSDRKPSNSYRNSRFSRDDRRGESATVTCADCGTQCEIPFVPKHDRPVYCSDCFRKNKPQDSGNDRYSRNDRNSRFSRDDRRGESATVTCADCGTQCEIPFVPKHDRPVYCSDCFRKNKPQDSGNDRYSRSNRESRSHNDSDNYRTRPKTAKLLKRQEALYSGGSEKFYSTLKEKLFDILGGKICSNCGFKDERALGICHVHNEDIFDNIRRGGSASSWGKYISEPDLAKKELRVLCLNCNEIRQPISRPKQEENRPTSNHKRSKYFDR